MTVVRLTSGLTGGRSVVPTSIVLEDLDSRATCWTIINAAWGQLAFACLVVILGVVGIPLQIAFGDSVTTVVGCVTMGTGFFCLAGCANALWRMYWFLPKARRHATGRRDVYEKAWDRTTPTNAAVVFQAAIGLLAVVITATSG